MALAFRAELAGERAAGRAQVAAVSVGPSPMRRSPARPAGTRAEVRDGMLEIDVPSGLRLPLPPLGRVHLGLPLAVGPA